MLGLEVNWTTLEQEVSQLRRRAGATGLQCRAQAKRLTAAQLQNLRARLAAVWVLAQQNLARAMLRAVLWRLHKQHIPRASQHGQAGDARERAHRSEHLYGHIHKKLKGLTGLYMAGQWVEPGGGVPTAIASGRQVVELLCHDTHEPFVAG